MKALTGFHGKLPSAGDFVMRGLPVGFAAFWDAWAARHLGHRHNDWPDGGLRLRLVSGGRVAAGIVIPSADRVGRRFPLAAFVIAGTLPDPADLDPWADAAHSALQKAQGSAQLPDDLAAELQHLQLAEGKADGPAMQLWSKACPPLSVDPETPQAALERLFSCSGSSRP